MHILDCRRRGRCLAALCVALATLAGAEAPADAAPRTLGDGAWCWFADPRGVRFDGLHRRTYVGWVAQDGDIKVSAYDHDSLTRTTAVLESRLQIDDHSNPALQVLDDGRIRVYYSAHDGATMYYRTSRAPEDITSWQAASTMPTNTSGTRGFTYPNPLHLTAEHRRYLFWRGGNWNPTFSTQADGTSSWSTAANLVLVSGQRPYVKYASNGSNTIGFAFTNAHPVALSDINIYYAYYRAGSLYRVNGTRIGSLGQAISPSQASKVYDTASKAWIHDVALDASGRPVIVFAAFPSTGDHRYMYSRWTGTSWSTSQITPAGGSISLDGKEPYYSGGITLDHEDPSTVYLSRNVAGVFQVETWKTSDGGASWSKQDVSAPDTVNNLRPISPRGMIPFSGDLSVVWVRGIYNSYVDYKTSLTTILTSGGNRAPIADAERSPRSGPAPQAVTFDATASQDPDGSIAAWSWDFGDGTQASGAGTSHTYTSPGTYFPALTVTDNAGARDVFVSEVVVDPATAPSASTGAPSGTSQTAATLNATVNPRNQPTTYRFEYGLTAAYGSTTAGQPVAPADNAGHAVSSTVTGLAVGSTYHYRVIATNATGSAAGVDRTFSTAAPPPSMYRAAVLGTAGLIAYWRMGEATGSVAVDEKGANHGNYSGGLTLGDPGALTGDSDLSAHFDGASGEMTAPATGLAASGTLEGWFDWRSGTALLRDHTSGNGWILAYDSAGALWYRAGGSAFNTGRTAASLRGAWHHVAITKSGGNVSFYLDGALIHNGTGAASVTAAMPWHIMRNGIYAQYANGDADEVAVYDRALPSSAITQHYQTGRGQQAAAGSRPTARVRHRR